MYEENRRAAKLNERHLRSIRSFLSSPEPGQNRTELETTSQEGET